MNFDFIWGIIFGVGFTMVLVVLPTGIVSSDRGWTIQHIAIQVCGPEYKIRDRKLTCLEVADTPVNGISLTQPP